MVSVDTLLNSLPPFSNNQIVIDSDQGTKDIINEVLNAHKYFSGDYDAIYNYFDTGDIYTTCENLFDFCKQNIPYEIQGENEQTTKSASAILLTKKNDCKNFAGFISGVLSAIERNTGEKINWCYRFASYSYLRNEPEHVFVVVKDGKKEIWIDPVLDYFDLKNPGPINYTDKKIKNTTMLKRMSGIEDGNINVIDTLKNYVRELYLYGIIDESGKLNVPVYFSVLEGLAIPEKQNLNIAYQFVKKYMAQNSIGSFWDTLAEIGKGILQGATGAGTPQANAAPIVTAPPPLTPIQTLEKYLPIIVLSGVGLFLIIKISK